MREYGNRNGSKPRLRMSLMSTQSVRMSAQPIEILLVEDDDDDVRLTKKAFEKDRILNRVHRVEDGIEAMEFLRAEGAFVDAVRPDLVLLDLNLPRMTGREVLQEIKQDPALEHIPVVILSTSDDERDVAFSQENFADGFITKPVDLDKFREVLNAVEHYWFSVVRISS